jgi:hypothetical protein
MQETDFLKLNLDVIIEETPETFEKPKLPKRKRKTRKKKIIKKVVKEIKRQVKEPEPTKRIENKFNSKNCIFEKDYQERLKYLQTKLMSSNKVKNDEDFNKLINKYNNAIDKLNNKTRL